MPAGETQTKLGTKKISDLVNGVVLRKSGDTIKASGELKTITEPWTEFSNADNTGHFIPIQFPEKWKGQQVTLVGSKNGDKTIQVDSDLLLIQRLENLKDGTLTVKHDSDPDMKFDFTGLIPIGKKALDQEKTYSGDYGDYGKSEKFVENLKIEWDGTKGKATGIMKKYTKEDGSKVESGNHFPLALSPWYDQSDKTVGIKNPKSVKDKDIIFTVTDKTKPIVVTYDGVEVMEIDFSDMKIEPYVGADAVVIPKQTTDMETVDQASKLIHTNVKITWENNGTNGKVTGTVHKYQMEGGHFNNAEGHYLPIVIEGHDSEDITVTGSNNQTQTLAENKWIVKLEGFKEKKSKVKFAAGGVTLAELDVQDLKFEP